MTTDTTRKGRFFSIDILKALAVILILNHRMQISYGDYSFLATGGALGCGLFFFISGYIIAVAGTTTFAAWMQKRIGRLMPTVLIAAFFGNFGVQHVFGSAFMWFVHCLVAYFIAFYFIKAYALKYLHPIIACCCALYSVYFFCGGHADNLLYGLTRGKYFLFFIFYLCGVSFRLHEWRPQGAWRCVVLILTPILLIAEMALRLAVRSQLISDYLLLASPVLLIAGITGLFIITERFNNLSETSVFRRWLAPVFASIAALSLESYIGIGSVSHPLQHALAPLFPYNLPLVVIALLLFCYFLRVCTRLSIALINGKPEDLRLSHILAPY